MAKENDEETRKKKKKNTHTHAHPERNFIKLFITFRKTKSYHVLRINDTLSLFSSLGIYNKSVIYTSYLCFSQLGKLVKHKIHDVCVCVCVCISWTTAFPDDTEPGKACVSLC